MARFASGARSSQEIWNLLRNAEFFVISAALAAL
jgi:hypothetical protein